MNTYSVKQEVEPIFNISSDEDFNLDLELEDFEPPSRTASLITDPDLLLENAATKFEPRLDPTERPEIENDNLNVELDINPGFEESDVPPDNDGEEELKIQIIQDYKSEDK